MKFICDVMVLKLGRILILSGFDTRTIKEPLPLTLLIEISINEDRLLITRNTKIKNYRFNNYILINEQNPYDQFKTIIKTLNLKLDKQNIFTRCSLCNSKLIEIEKEKIIEKVPPKTLKTAREFFICIRCNKIYWKESHYDFFIKKIEEFL